MKNIKHLFSLLIFAFLAFQCNDDNDQKHPIDPYAECCGAEAVEYTVGNAKLYIPNAFTPNGDGINDLFFPNINNKVSKIDFFAITSSDLGLIYIEPTLDISNPSANGWNGIDADGKKYSGLFRYSMTVTDDAGILKTITGSACSIICDSNASVFKTKTGCFFPAQSDGNGGLDGSLPSFEEDCFGN